MSKAKSQNIETSESLKTIAGPCSTCRWSLRENNGVHRCHANPPQIRTPYDNLAAWPVVPEQGGGCRLWEAKL